MVKKKETKDDKKAYKAIGLVFISVGVVFLFNDSMRTMGIVFAILACTFLTLGLDEKN